MRLAAVFRPRLLPLAALLGACGASAQTDPVQAAADAFGTSIGRESLGLYTSSAVRGFSPTKAGNVRIDGLYFDPATDLIPQLRESTQLRVGLSAQGQSFPAPTGIVDHRLRRPGPQAAGELQLGGDDFGSRYLDLSLSQALSPTWGLQASGSRSHNDYGNSNGGSFRAASLGLWGRWPGAAGDTGSGSELGLFSSRNEQLYDVAGQELSPAGAQLPPPHPWRSDGPHWARHRSQRSNHGLLARHAWQTASGQWELRAGWFRSRVDIREGYALLIQQLQADGSGQRLLIADPPGLQAASSGELRLSWTLPGSAQFAQRLQAQFSGRLRDRRAGGAQRIDYGAMQLGEAFEPPKPDFRFGASTEDRVRQHNLGLAYALRAWQRLELHAGLQQANYRKAVQAPDRALERTQSEPLLGYLSAAWEVDAELAFYAGLSRGLEESGVAPSSASNAGQAMPALLSSQSDLGLRWQAGPRMKLVAGLFEVRKPYYNLDAQQRFTALGQVRHRGAEFSLSGEPAPGWRLVAGLQWMQAQVEGDAVRLGRVGPKPVGVPERLAKLNLVWRPAALAGLSLDLALHHIGSMAATRDNAVRLPASSRVNLGLRAPLRWGGRDAGSLRLVINNLGNARGHDLLSAGNYFPHAPRSVSASWTLAW